MSITSPPKNTVFLKRKKKKTIEHLVGNLYLKLFSSLLQGADGVRGLKGHKGEKVRFPHDLLPQMPKEETFLGAFF